MTVYYRTPQLPWSDGGDQHRFIPILVGFLLFVMVVGIIIPFMDVPQLDRKELEKLPPQLAKVIERKKLEKPKPLPPKKEEKKPEPKPELKPEPKPEPPKPKPEPPKPKPQPKPKPKVEAPKEKREQAKETAKKAFGNDALNALSSIRSQVPIAALNTSSKGLSNAGKQATNIGTVVDRNAATRGSGGVDVATLTTATVGEQLTERQVTAVEMTAEQQEAEAAATTRSQEELRLVLEPYKVHFDRLYRSALRKNPALSGSLTLKAEIQPNGTVSSCSVINSELKDEALHKRLASKCRQMQFADRKGIDVTVAEFPINFMP